MQDWEYKRRYSKSQIDHYYRTPAPSECACDCWTGHRILNVESTHYAVCDVCRHFTSVGANLFSSWKHETEEVWQRNEEELSLMSECTCIFEVENYNESDLQYLRQREYEEAARS